MSNDRDAGNVGIGYLALLVEAGKRPDQDTQWFFECFTERNSSATLMERLIAAAARRRGVPEEVRNDPEKHLVHVIQQTRHKSAAGDRGDAEMRFERPNDPATWGHMITPDYFALLIEAANKPVGDVEWFFKAVEHHMDFSCEGLIEGLIGAAAERQGVPEKLCNSPGLLLRTNNERPQRK